MRIRAVAVVALAALVACVGAVPLRADTMAEQIRKVRDAALPSTVIISFYLERDDGARADVRMLGTVVGPQNLVMISSAAIPAQFATSQFRDFKVIVAKGDELQTFDAEFLGKDDQSQVAFVRVTDVAAPALPVLVFDEGAKLDVGDPIVTVANLGEPDRYERVMQMTRIGARIDQPVTTYLATDSLGAPGTPVMTLDGKAVGIVGFVRLNRGTNARPNFGVSSVVWPAARFIERVKNPPKGGAVVKRPWLGVQTLSPVTKDLAEYYKLGDRRGVVVGQVLEKSPAEKAGLKAEDIVLAVNGKDLKGTEGQLVENFTNDLKERKIGDELTMEIWRGGKTQTVKVTLAEQPKGAAEAERYKCGPVGFTVREMVLADRVNRELPASETGVVVAFVAPAGWASDGGLKENDIVKKVQDQETPTLGDFKRVFDAEMKKKPKELVLFVLRSKNETQLIRIEPRWDAAEKPKTDGPAETKPDAEKKPEAGK